MSIIYALIQKYLLINYFMCLAITRDNAVTNKSFSFMKLIFYSDGGIEKTNKQKHMYNMPCGGNSCELS